MVTFVVVTNLLIALLNFYLAWRILKLRSAIAIIRNNLQILEQKATLIFAIAPKAITIKQLRISILRNLYRDLTRQILQIQKILVLINLLVKLRPLIITSKIKPVQL